MSNTFNAQGDQAVFQEPRDCDVNDDEYKNDNERKENSDHSMYFLFKKIFTLNDNRLEGSVFIDRFKSNSAVKMLVETIPAVVATTTTTTMDLKRLSSSHHHHYYSSSSWEYVEELKCFENTWLPVFMTHFNEYKPFLVENLKNTQHVISYGNQLSLKITDLEIPNLLIYPITTNKHHNRLVVKLLKLFFNE